MKWILPFFFLLFLNGNLFSQTDTDYLKITGKVTDKISDKPIEKVTVTITKGKEVIEMVETDAEGNYKLKNVALNQNYFIQFYKKKYCYKFAAIMISDTSGNELDGSFPMEVNCSLFKTGLFKKIRLRFLNTEPVAIARYDATEDNMIWDMEYIENMANKIKRRGGK